MGALEELLGDVLQLSRRSFPPLTESAAVHEADGRAWGGESSIHLGANVQELVLLAQLGDQRRPADVPAHDGFRAVIPAGDPQEAAAHEDERAGALAGSRPGVWLRSCYPGVTQEAPYKPKAPEG